MTIPTSDLKTETLAQMNDSNLSAKSFEIYSQTDVAFAALEARKFAENIGFKKTEQYMISTAVSELARNMIIYAEQGTIQLNVIKEDLKQGMEVVAEDSGPGIKDIKKATLIIER